MAEGGFDSTFVVESSKVNQVCRFYLEGKCTRGEQCRYLHDASKKNVCRYYLMGCCKYGSECRYDHNIVKPEQAQEEGIVEERQCGICLDAITDNRFGILEKCSHIFCLPCIRMWRQGKSLDFHLEKTCPMCRSPSDIAVPSYTWIDSAKEKEDLLNNYRRAMQIVRVYATVYLSTKCREAVRDINGPTLEETVTYLAKLTIDEATQDIPVSEMDTKNYWHLVPHFEANVEKALQKAKEASKLDEDAMIALGILMEVLNLSFD